MKRHSLKTENLIIKEILCCVSISNIRESTKQVSLRHIAVCFQAFLLPQHKEPCLFKHHQQLQSIQVKHNLNTQQTVNNNIQIPVSID